MKVIVKQTPENEVPTEVLATAIVGIAQAMKKIRTGRLNDAALTTLISQAMPASKRVAASTVWDVLDGISSLEAKYIRKRT